jgi:hypothetical protein
MFDGDPIMQEIIAEGRRLREEDCSAVWPLSPPANHGIIE